MADKKEEISKTKYTCWLTFGARDGKTYRRGDIVELDDSEAKYLNKLKAIRIYFEDGEDAPEAELPKPKRKKPAAPKKLEDSQTVVPDPKAK